MEFGSGRQRENVYLARASTSNGLQLDIHAEGSYTHVKAPDAIRLGEWQHFAATVDANGNAVLYRNGAKVGSGKLRMPRNTERFMNYIGKSSWESGNHFTGLPWNGAK